MIAIIDYGAGNIFSVKNIYFNLIIFKTMRNETLTIFNMIKFFNAYNMIIMPC